MAAIFWEPFVLFVPVSFPCISTLTLLINPWTLKIWLLFLPLVHHISLLISYMYENLMLDKDNNFYEISLSIGIICVLDDV